MAETEESCCVCGEPSGSDMAHWECERPLWEPLRIEPTCPRCDSVALVWHDGWGYRCPDCYLFVALPERAPDAV